MGVMGWLALPPFPGVCGVFGVCGIWSFRDFSIAFSGSKLLTVSFRWDSAFCWDEGPVDVVFGLLSPWPSPGTCRESIPGPLLLLLLFGLLPKLLSKELRVLPLKLLRGEQEG